MVTRETSMTPEKWARKIYASHLEWPFCQNFIMAGQVKDTQLIWFAENRLFNSSTSPDPFFRMVGQVQNTR